MKRVVRRRGRHRADDKSLRSHLKAGPGCEGSQPAARAWRTPAATIAGNTGWLGNPSQLPGWAQGSDATNTAPACSACSMTKVSGDQPLA